MQNINLSQNISELIDLCRGIDTEIKSISQWSSAVNFLFVQDNLFLIKRSEHMSSHKGQLAFVGGHRHETETDPIVTAQREFQEETGIDSNLLQTYGLSYAVRTTSHKVIIPVVSYLEMDPKSFLNTISSNGEWTNGILVNHKDITRWDYWVRANATYENFCSGSVLFFPISSVTYLSKIKNSSDQLLLWGATAKMIWKFFKNYS